MARARRGDPGPGARAARAPRALDARLPRPGALELLQRVEPRAALGRVRAARTAPDPELPQVRASRAARSDDVGLALARAAPRPADASARLDLLAARGAALRDGVVAGRGLGSPGRRLRRRACASARVAARGAHEGGGARL